MYLTVKWQPFTAQRFRVQRLQLIDTAQHIDIDPEYPTYPMGVKLHFKPDKNRIPLI